MGKFNIQTLRHTHLKKKGPIHKVDHRGIHRARPGHTFIISDSAQIEPRCLNYLSGNWKFLDACAHKSVYQAAAEFEGVWTPGQGELKKMNPVLYALKKASTLALGYNAGFIKFVEMTPGYLKPPLTVYDVIGCECTVAEWEDFIGYTKYIDKRNHTNELRRFLASREDDRERKLYCRSYHTVKQWRLRNPHAVKQWNLMQSLMTEAIANKEDMLELILPSGRPLRYYKPRLVKVDGDMKMFAYRTMHPKRSHRDLRLTYGGLITENCTQAFARDVFCWQYVQICEAGISVLWTMHDELIAEVPVSKADVAYEFIKKTMQTSPPWAARLPVNCDIKIVERYEK